MIRPIVKILLLFATGE
jgi:Uncharacterized protein conserved in bacteria (DUF2188)